MSDAERPPTGGEREFPGQTIDVSELPDVPADRKAVSDEADGAVWRIAEGSRAECLRGLHELATQGENLGDLAPSTSTCAAAARELEVIYAVLDRIDAIKQYVEARRALIEPRADAMLRDARLEVSRRIERGRLHPESYRGVRAYADAHSVAVSQGIARAAKMRAEIKAASAANDAHAHAPAPARTGTENR